MIDFHSHFLPKMDDGSSNLGESLQMLKLSYTSGIDTVVSTSHYYAEHERIDDFIERRAEKIGWLTPHLDQTLEYPEIRLGAEVTYFSGISSEKHLKKLCVEGTNYLLVEMPYAEWTSLNIKELRSLILNRGITPILAHVERYLPYQHKNKIDELLSLGVVFQANGDSVIDLKQRKQVLKLIKTEKIQLLGSDCHNMRDRPPNLDAAYKIIEKEIGSAPLQKIEVNGRRIFQNSAL